ncbi:MAG: hypothetical protein AB8I08_12615 [Sandaracinaceae bacterium]
MRPAQHIANPIRQRRFFNGLLARLALASFLVLSLSANLAQAQAPAPMTDAVHVRVVGADGTALHESGQSCEVPCELTLAVRNHRFGVSLRGGDVQTTDSLAIERPGLLRAEYEDRSQTRSAGWSVFGVAMTLAAASGITAGLADAAVDDTEEGDNLGAHLLALTCYGLAFVHLVIAAAIGLPLAALGDGASVRFE